MAGTQYLFGDSDVAERRLRLVAETFSPSTRAFLADTVTDTPRLVVDLGCGPGHTTHLLVDILGCALGVGLDSSERFVALASRTATKRVVFRLHDVTSVPFPTEPADLLFCRFLVTHLTDPRAVIARWPAAMARRSLLLMEETEWIRTGNRIYARYLDIVEAMLAAQSNTLYVGPLLARLEGPENLRRRESRVWRLPVLHHQAAGMFLLNLLAWREQPFIRANYSPELIDELACELASMTESSREDAEIEWGLRQVTFERV